MGIGRVFDFFSAREVGPVGEMGAGSVSVSYNAAKCEDQVRRNDTERIDELEKEMSKLEGVVNTLARVVESEHKAMKERLQEDREEMKEFGRRMEATVKSISIEIGKKDGAVVFGKYIGGVLLALGALVISIVSLQDSRPRYIYVPERAHAAPASPPPFDGRGWPPPEEGLR